MRSIPPARLPVLQTAVHFEYCIPDHSGVSSQSRYAHSHVYIDRDDLLLIRGQLGGGSLQRYDDSVIFIFHPNCDSSLFDCLHGVLHLMDSALGTPNGDITVVLVPELEMKKASQSTWLQ